MSSPQHTSKDINITIPLSELLHIILGDYFGSMKGIPSAPIPKKTALILDNILKGNESYKVVWPNENSPDTELPVLWHTRAWMEDEERKARLKAYSEKLRIEGWIKKANHEMVIKAIMKQCKGLPYDNASAMAMRLLNNSGAVTVLQEFWGIKKFITKEEEL